MISERQRDNRADWPGNGPGMGWPRPRVAGGLGRGEKRSPACGLAEMGVLMVIGCSAPATA